MSRRDMEKQSLDALLCMLFDLSLSEAQWDELRARLMASASARETYRRYVRVHGLLEAELGWPKQNRVDFESTEEASLTPAGIEPISSNSGLLSAIAASDDSRPPLLPSAVSLAHGKEGGRFGRASWRRSVAASILLVVLPVAGLLAHWRHRSFATCVETTAISLHDAASAPTAGRRVGSSLFGIDRGTMRFKLDDGAEVTVAAPATFKILSSRSVELDHGLLHAVAVGGDSGFSVITPHARIIDLGTEFGVAVDGAGDSQVHVMNGRVKLEVPAYSFRRDVVAGEARGVDAAGNAIDVVYSPRLFSFAARMNSSSPFDRWMAYSELLEHDPALRAHFTFAYDPLRPDRLSNEASSNDRVGDGVVHGGAWVSGRFPGKSALHFDATADRVTLNVPGQFSAISLWAWVRVESLHQKYMALLASDGWYRPNLLHWNLMKPDRLNVGICTANREQMMDANSVSGAFQAESAQWTLLAASWDRTGTVRFYRDGKLLNVFRRERPVQFGIGSAEIGNWDARPQRQDRHFHGSIDEFGISARVMDDAEMRQLFENTRP